MTAIYDKSRFTARQVLPLTAPTGVSVPGTAASATQLIRLRMTDYMTVDKGGVVATTGGTAAGPTIIFQRSVAGTGTAVAFATHAFGTDADNDGAAITVTSTDFDPGDELIVVNAAGTAASTPVATLMLGWKETFLGS